MKKKIWPFIVLLISVLVLTACSTGSANLTPEKSPQQMVEESFDKWYGLKSYDMDMIVNMKISVEEEVLDMSMTGQGTVFQNPMKMKTLMETTVPGMDQKVTIEQYAVQDEEKMTIYQHIGPIWQKTTIDDPVSMEMLTMDPRDNLKLFVDNLTSAEILGEEKIGDRDALKIKLVASGDIFSQLYQETIGSALGVGHEVINADIISQIGDMVYIIWVDKTTLDILKCQMDLSENMKSLGSALANDPNVPDFPAEMIDIFANIEMFMEYTVLNHNNARDFVIPEEALKAPEVELPTA